MATQWVDFRAVKHAVSVQQVLAHYGITWLKRSGKELRGRCPIHRGEGADAFHVNLEKNCFQCFSCKARGNVLDLVAAMEQCNVREAALKLQDWFSVGSSDESKPASQPIPAGNRGVELAKNPPLSFQLKSVDPHHPYLAERGIRPETAQLFGVGFFAGKGSMNGRVVIPIHNERGDLIAYAGRAIEVSKPKYKLPAGFQKSLELFNLHRAIAGKDGGAQSTVVVVEGFFGTVRVHEAGYPCVALMGSTLSVEQERLLCLHFTGALLMFDGDEAGRAATDECLLRLGRKLWVKGIQLPEGSQPDSLTVDELHQLLSS